MEEKVEANIVAPGEAGGDNAIDEDKAVASLRTKFDAALADEIVRARKEAAAHFGPEGFTPVPLPNVEQFVKIVEFINASVAQFGTGGRCTFAVFVTTEGLRRLRKPFPECMDGLRVWFEGWYEAIGKCQPEHALYGKRALEHVDKEIKAYFKHLETLWNMLHTESRMEMWDNGWTIIYQEPK